MPARGKSKSRKRTHFRKGVRGRLNRLAQDVKAIKKAQEVKYIDQTVDNQTMNFTGTVLALNPCAQGTDVDQRLGNKITMKSLNVRGYVVGNAQNLYNVMRVILFLDTANQGSDPTSADVLQTTGDNLATIAPLNKDKTPRFRILYDRVFTGSQSAPEAFQFKYFRKFRKGLNLEYTGTTSTSYYKKTLYLLYVSDVNTNDPTINFYSRVGYTDS